jgi:hypothetical protein
VTSIGYNLNVSILPGRHGTGARLAGAGCAARHVLLAARKPSMQPRTAEAQSDRQDQKRHDHAAKLLVDVRFEF